MLRCKTFIFKDYIAYSIIQIGQTYVFLKYLLFVAERVTLREF